MRVCRLPIDMEVEPNAWVVQRYALMCRRCVSFAANAAASLKQSASNRRYRTAKRRLVRVGRDTGRLRIRGRKRLPAQSPGRGSTVSKFFACAHERAVTRRRYALCATSRKESRAQAEPL